jgi:hypothetical protein
VGGRFDFLRPDSRRVKSPRTQKPAILEIKPGAGRGRPAGKRSDPKYVQITAYIRKETHQAVKMRLLQQNGGDFSELIEQRLAAWLNVKH